DSWKRRESRRGARESASRARIGPFFVSSGRNVERRGSRTGRRRTSLVSALGLSRSASSRRRGETEAGLARPKLAPAPGAGDGSRACAGRGPRFASEGPRLPTDDEIPEHVEVDRLDQVSVESRRLHLPPVALLPVPRQGNEQGAVQLGVVL